VAVAVSLGTTVRPCAGSNSLRSREMLKRRFISAGSTTMVVVACLRTTVKRSASASLPPTRKCSSAGQSRGALREWPWRSSQG
jgi:hypothetical protein